MEKLSEEDKRKIGEWLQANGATRPCPACGTNSWVIGDVVAIASQYQRGGMILGAGYPAVVVMCEKCALFRWHSAIVLGVVKGDQDEDAEVKNG